MKLSDIIVELATELAENGDRELSDNFRIVIIDRVACVTY